MKAVYSYLRTKKAEHLKNVHEMFQEVNSVGTIEVEEATILPVRRYTQDNLLFGRGGVLDNKNNYIVMSSIPKRVEGMYECEAIETKKSKVVYCGYLVNHWGHFLIEAVARLWYFVENDSDDIDKYVFIVDEGAPTEVKNNYKEFLELLGIWNKLEIINKPKKYRTVIIPELSYKYNLNYTMQFKKIFDRVIENAMKKKLNMSFYEKVFLSRSQFVKARQAESGLDMLDDFFEKNGYQVVFPEQISLTELIHLLQNAKECASESGTTPHNIMFGYDGQQLTIVERQTILNHIQANIDCIRDLTVTYIDGHYTIYPVSAGYGPFILAYNNLFQKYTNDHNLNHPGLYYSKEEYIEKCLRQYMNTYKKEYYKSWGLESWQINYADSIYEAYEDTYQVLGDYLSGRKIYKRGQVLELRFVKQIIKKMICK